MAILVLAGIRSLPKEPFEASEVDGANWFYMFRKLMLPMLWPYILVAVIFRFMDNLKVFDHIYVLTAGGPGCGHPHPADRRVRGLDHQPRLLPRQHLHVAALDHRVHHRALPGERARKSAASCCRSGVLEPWHFSAEPNSFPARSACRIGAVAADIGVIVWFLFSLFPIFWMVMLALKNAEEQTTTYFSFSPTWSNFATVLSDKGTQMTSVDFKTAMLTSLLNCGGAVIVSLVIGIPAAYAAGRWKYKGSNDLMFQMLSFRFAPELMVIVPLFVIYNQIGLFDTKVGMIWVLQLVTMPLVVWILRSYFEDLPEDLEQAALLDGYTRTRAFVMVALPIVRPGIAAAALLAFIFAWNNYVFPLILADSNAGTVTVAITKFLGGGGQAYYNLTAAAALIAALPPLILALTIQRYLVRGLSFGAVKA